MAGQQHESQSYAKIGASAIGFVTCGEYGGAFTRLGK